MQTVKTKIVVGPKEIMKRRAIVKDDLDRYLDLRAKEKAIKEEMEKLRAEIAGEMMNLNVSTVEGSTGRAMLVTKRSASWSIDAVKDAFGKTWTAYVKADDTRIKKSLDLVDVDVRAKLDASATMVESVSLDIR
jgi:hypothetical protein